MEARQIAFALLVAGCVWGASASSAGAQTQNGQPDTRGRQMLFRDMDTDGDGVITRAEWRGSDQAFRDRDSNHDGVLSGDEIWRTRRQSGVQEEFDRLDRNHNGVVTQGEWLGRPEDFRALDMDGDGVVTRREFRQDRDAVESDAYRAGRSRGLADGRQAGREDKTVNGGKWDLEGQRELETADAGYDANLGSRADYQAGYRAGFRTGYREGFGPR